MPLTGHFTWKVLQNVQEGTYHFREMLSHARVYIEPGLAKFAIPGHSNKQSNAQSTSVHTFQKNQPMNGLLITVSVGLY